MRQLAATGLQLASLPYSSRLYLWELVIIGSSSGAKLCCSHKSLVPAAVSTFEAETRQSLVQQLRVLQLCNTVVETKADCCNLFNFSAGDTHHCSAS